ncbi:MAG: hypothetical protein ACXWBS_03755 [Chthoniobacterales bacterium]
MKINIAILVAVLSGASLAFAQSPAPASSPAAASTGSVARTDLYHVHLAKSALGKAAEHGESLKKQDPNAPMKGHFVVLRHQDGDAWDYCVIEHLGTKSSIDATRPAPPAGQGALGDWHTDTLCLGPSWTEFAKQMGLDDASKSSASGYVVSVYRPAPGQREALDKMLNAPPDRTTDVSAGNVVLQHMEGAAWTFMAIARYNTWADFAKDEVNSIPKTNQPDSQWSKLRNLVSFHTDTLCDRITP